MKNLWPGYKTNANTVLMAIIGVLFLTFLANATDPVRVIAQIKEWYLMVIAVPIILATTGIWFRSLAD